MLLPWRRRLEVRPIEVMKLRTGGAIPWTPAYMAIPPIFWWDHSTSVTNVSGAASTWANKGSGGTDYDLIQSTAANRPTINASGLNSLRTLTYDGTNDNMVSNTMVARAYSNNVSSMWVGGVMRKTTVDGAATFRTVWQTNTGTNITRMSMTIGSSGGANQPALIARRLDADSAALLAGAGTLGTSTFHIVMVTMDYAGRPGNVYVDGFLVGNNATLTTAGSTSATTTTDQMSVGSSYSGGGTATPASWADMELANLMGARNGIPATLERQKWEGYQAWLYGLTANLDASHPYKSVPPTL
jgi:hypothetical protein